MSWSWASASSCPHVRPIFIISASTSRRQLFRGRPLFLLPCGFQESDSLVMFGLAFLRVWPIHLHRLWRISTSIGCWFVLRHSSWLLIISGQWISSIFLRQVLRKVCNFFVLATVVLQVSAPYNRTGLTIELKMRSLVFVERMVDLQTLLSWWNAALALPILILMSASVPPCLSTLLPKYVKESTSSRGLSPSTMGVVFSVLTLRIWLFVGWISSPMRAEFWLMIVVFSCI